MKTDMLEHLRNENGHLTEQVDSCRKAFSRKTHFVLSLLALGKVSLCSSSLGWPGTQFLLSLPLRFWIEGVYHHAQIKEAWL